MRSSFSTRRTRATTSCEVGPAGLSMTSTPSIRLQDCRIAGLQDGRMAEWDGLTRQSFLQFCDPPILQLDRVLQLLDERLLQRVDGAGHRAPGGVLVAAAAEFLRDRADVDVAL